MQGKSAHVFGKEEKEKHRDFFFSPSCSELPGLSRHHGEVQGFFTFTVFSLPQGKCYM